MKLTTYSLLTITLFISIMNTALAVPIDEKYEVLKQAEHYSKVKACSTSFDGSTTAKDVFLIKSKNYENEPEFGTDYIVLWSGDDACMGGSGTYFSYLTHFSREENNKPFLLNQEVMSDRFIDEVTTINGILSVTVGEHDEGDSNNFPTLNFRYNMIFDTDTYEWKHINKQFLGKNSSP